MHSSRYGLRGLKVKAEAKIYLTQVEKLRDQHNVPLWKF